LGVARAEDIGKIVDGLELAASAMPKAMKRYCGARVLDLAWPVAVS
jgi:hypothetical protein